LPESFYKWVLSEGLISDLYIAKWQEVCKNHRYYHYHGHHYYRYHNNYYHHHYYHHYHHCCDHFTMFFWGDLFQTHFKQSDRRFVALTIKVIIYYCNV
jgi:hypothetical protein